ncbi:MAG: NADH-quinone oxidoreductase subunit A [Armatimonadetes bacterium]|nr:NADH-quinone oxidoreductase subunit A [Armatimonadota bacterium]
MPETAETTLKLWPLALYAALVLVTAAGMLLVSYVLGPRQNRGRPPEPYESGVVPTGSARPRIAVEFYLVAVFFVIFDLEAVFIFAWATAVREVGWAGYFEILLFIAILVAGLVYLWRQGALDWGPVAERRRAREQAPEE